MCCTDFDLPDEVAAMLRRYEGMRDLDPDGLWGDRQALWARALLYRCPFLPEARRGDVLERIQEDSEWLDSPAFPAWLRDVVAADGRPPELSVVHFHAEGRPTADPASPFRMLPGTPPIRRSVLLVSDRSEPMSVAVDGRTVEVPGNGAALIGIEVSAARPGISVAQTPGPAADHCELALVRPLTPARLRLQAGMCVRWSVVDDEGVGWFPAGAVQKRDRHDRPFFHGEDVIVEVPPGDVVVQAARGIEYRSAISALTVAAGEERTVSLTPARWMDPAAQGWYGADLHVHMNYGERLVIGPKEAAVMQWGEGLHFMNLLAANMMSSLIYDREALEAWPGVDLPWSAGDILARAGVEYRNDLLGHFHATGPTAPPSRYHTGHAGSDADEDWPPNSVALEEFRSLDAVTGYCHPVRDELSDNSPPDAVFARIRTVECRELVADAALGLVDGMDVVSNFDGPGSAVLYRRLLGAGVRLTATVGTDSMLSHAHAGTYSNPPGWARMYAHVNGPLTAESLKDAVRSGRTVATNGPWLELTVNGAEVGSRLDVPAGDTVQVRALVRGVGVDRLRIYTADGVLASTSVDGFETTLEADLLASEPNFVVAMADGPSHPEVLAVTTMAHTSPVYVDVAGQSVARSEHALWCLEWLAQLEKLAVEHGVFHQPEHRDELLHLLDRARDYYRTVAS